MKKLLALLLFALPCMGQNPLFITSSFNTATAATPTFSPAAGAVANPTTVTASSTTTGTGCTIYFDTSPTPTTAQTTYSVTTAVTLYAQVRGCSGYNNSAVASAAYTIVVPFVVSASAGRYEWVCLTCLGKKHLYVASRTRLDQAQRHASTTGHTVILGSLMLVTPEDTLSGT